MVHFVGAGPGAPDLLTIRGKQLLEEADVVIYAGSLVNPELLSFCRPGVEIHNSALMTLNETHSVIREAEQTGKITVRLHTGDPSIYGAIREQMDLLRYDGIDFDITPGVSSFTAAAAALQIEYTLPAVSQSVIITRAEGRTKMPERETLRSFASHGSTMVLFLSAGLLEDVRTELLAGGLSRDTPSAIVYKAGWPDERKILTDVAHLPEEARKAGISKTALVIVGNVLATEGYEPSRLYSETFSTEFREAVRKDENA